MVSDIFLDGCLYGEPTLEEILADPIVRLIMKRDGINEGEMRGQLDRVLRGYQSLLEAQ